MNCPRCQCVNPPRQKFCRDCLRLSTDSAPSAAPVAGETQKCLQLLKELAPRATRVALLLNPDNPFLTSDPGVLGSAAARLGITLVKIEIRTLAGAAEARRQIIE